MVEGLQGTCAGWSWSRPSPRARSRGAARVVQWPKTDWRLVTCSCPREDSNLSRPRATLGLVPSLGWHQSRGAGGCSGVQAASSPGRRRRWLWARPVGAPGRTRTSARGLGNRCSSPLSYEGGWARFSARNSTKEVYGRSGCPRVPRAACLAARWAKRHVAWTIVGAGVTSETRRLAIFDWGAGTTSSRTE